MLNPNKTNNNIRGTVSFLPDSFDDLGSIVIDTPYGAFEAYGSGVGARAKRFRLGDSVELSISWSLILDDWYVNKVTKRRA